MIDETQWPKKGRPKNGTIPYGYIMEGGDPASLVPDPVLVPLIEKAFDSIENGSSYREVADWLNSEYLERSISHTALVKLFKTKREGSKRVLSIAKKKKAMSKEEKAARKLGRSVGAEKRRITAAQKRIEALEAKKEGLSEEEALQKLKAQRRYTEMEDLPEDYSDQEIVFQPNPGPQTEFLASTELQVLYGGAAGGGKSYAMLADPMRYFDNPNFYGLLIRRTNDELRNLKMKSFALYKKYNKDAEWREKDSEWRFPSGARLWMSYLERDEDVQRYQGQEFTWIGIDELTQYSTPYAWNYLLTRLRTGDDTLPVCMRATTNPGGPGHQWVKKMFIDPAPANEAFWAKDIDTDKTLVIPDFFPGGHPLAGQPNPDAGKPLFQRRFIPSSVFDNPYLVHSGYVEGLMSGPEQLRRQLLEGDWTYADGAAFPEFRLHIHTTKPFQIPQDWKRFRSCDYGYSSYSAVHWYAIDPSYETLYVYDELYATKQTGRDLAMMIRERESHHNARPSYGVLDSACWHTRGFTGPTIAEDMINAGTRWKPSVKGPQSRVEGRRRLHELLKTQDIGGEQIPGIVFFDNCRQIISDLPVIPTDPHGGDDIDNKYTSDHAYDSIRYGIMSRPRGTSSWDFATTQMAFKPSDSKFGY